MFSPQQQQQQLGPLLDLTAIAAGKNRYPASILHCSLVIIGQGSWVSTLGIG